MYRCKPIDSLNLDDQLFANQHINPETSIELHTFINNRQLDLTPHG